MVDRVAADMEAVGEAKGGVATRAVGAQVVALPVRPAGPAVITAPGHPSGVPGAPAGPGVNERRPAIEVVGPRRAAGRTAAGGMARVEGSGAEASMATTRAKRRFTSALPGLPVAPATAQRQIGPVGPEPARAPMAATRRLGVPQVTEGTARAVAAASMADVVTRCGLRVATTAAVATASALVIAALASVTEPVPVALTAAAASGGADGAALAAGDACVVAAMAQTFEAVITVPKADAATATTRAG